MTVKEALNLLGLRSAYQLSKKLGITRQAVSLWFHAGVIPDKRVEEIKKLAVQRIQEK